MFLESFINIAQAVHYKLVSWSLMFLFSTNMAISEAKG